MFLCNKVREREGGKEREREEGKGGEREIEKVCVSVCVRNPGACFSII